MADRVLLLAGQCSGRTSKFIEIKDRIISESVLSRRSVTDIAFYRSPYNNRVMIRNPGAMERSWKQFWLRAEKIWTDLCESKLLEYRLIVFRVYKKLPGLLNRIF